MSIIYQMPISKARNAARMRINRAKANGVHPSPIQEFEIMPIYQRKERLAELIATKIPADKVNAANIIAAVDILNKMDKVYTDFPTGNIDNRQYNIIIQGGDEAKERLERLLAGTRRKELEEPQDE